MHDERRYLLLVEAPLLEKARPGAPQARLQLMLERSLCPGGC